MAFKKGDKKPENSGKKKGTQNKVTTQLKEMILEALDESDPGGGKAYLKKQAKLNPTAFLTLIGKVLPTTLVGDPNSPLFPKLEIILKK